MNLVLKNNLRKLMIKHGNMSVSDLAKATSLPQPTLYQLYTGVTARPRKKTLAALAEYFSVSVEQLIGKENLPNQLPQNIKEQLELNTVPILDWKDLPFWPGSIDLTTKKEIFLDKKATPETFAVQMIDDSMEPIFPSGCLLIFDAQKETKDKDCALIFESKTNQFSFKKIFLDGNTVIAQSINPAPQATKAMQLTKQDKIIATLLEARLTF